MILLDVAVDAIVAGVNAGAGAVEIVCVRDVADRDLSRNSMTDFCMTKDDKSVGIEWHGWTHFRICNRFKSVLILRSKRFFQWHNESGYGACYRMNRLNQLILWLDEPFGLRRRKVKDKFSPLPVASEFL